MLRIMDRLASYDAATTLSIPELPLHAVQRGLPRQQESRHLSISLTQHVVELVRNHRRHDPNVNRRRDCPVPRNALRPRSADRKPRRRAILVRRVEAEMKRVFGEPVEERRADEQPAPRLVLRPVEPRAVPPAQRPGIGVHESPETAANADAWALRWSDS